MHVDVHENNRRFRCRFCERTFVQRVNCTQHERTHTNEKPFGCAYCPSKFASAKGRKRHEVARHSSVEQQVGREEVVEQTSSAEDLKVIVEMIGVDEPVLLEAAPLDGVEHEVGQGFAIVEVRQDSCDPVVVFENQESQ